MEHPALLSATSSVDPFVFPCCITAVVTESLVAQSVNRLLPQVLQISLLRPIHPASETILSGVEFREQGGAIVSPHAS